MKKIFFTLLIGFPILSYAQKIKSDGVDSFTGKRNIKTNFVSLKGDFKIQLAAVASKADTTFVMNFYFPTGVTSIDDHSGVSFKFSDSNVLDFVYLGDYELCSSHRLCNIYITLKRDNLDRFLKNKITTIRITTSSKKLDFDIQEKQAQKINELINLLLKQLEK